MPDLFFQDPVCRAPSQAKHGSNQSSSLQEQLCDNLFDGVYFVDKDRKITYWNGGAEKITGFAQDEVIGRHCFDNLLMHVNDDGCGLCNKGCPLSDTLADGNRREVEVYLHHKLGYRVPVCVRVAPVKDASGELVGAVEVFSDISAKKMLERRNRDLEAIAYLDPLTEVSNRRHIEMKVRQTIQECEEFGKAAGLLVVDIDHFKEVNDRFGHATGDVVLKTVSATLLNTLRNGDSVGRWGGEEFLLVVMDVDRGTLEAIAERCRNLIAKSPTFDNDRNIHVTVSIGATLFAPGESANSAFARADELMYTSKSRGRNRTTVG